MTTLDPNEPITEPGEYRINSELITPKEGIRVKNIKLYKNDELLLEAEESPASVTFELTLEDVGQFTIRSVASDTANRTYARTQMFTFAPEEPEESELSFDLYMPDTQLQLFAALNSSPHVIVFEAGSEGFEVLGEVDTYPSVSGVQTIDSSINGYFVASNGVSGAGSTITFGQWDGEDLVNLLDFDGRPTAGVGSNVMAMFDNDSADHIIYAGGDVIRSFERLESPLSFDPKSSTSATNPCFAKPRDGLLAITTLHNSQIRTYSDGAISEPIATRELSLGGFTVNDIAYSPNDAVMVCKRGQGSLLRVNHYTGGELGFAALSISSGRGTAALSKNTFGYSRDGQYLAVLLDNGGFSAYYIQVWKVTGPTSFSDISEADVFRRRPGWSMQTALLWLENNDYVVGFGNGLVACYRYVGDDEWEFAWEHTVASSQINALAVAYKALPTTPQPPSESV